MSGVRDALVSIDGRLDDLRREHAWRAIARKLDAAGKQRQPRWPWLFAPVTLAIAVLVVVAGARGRRTPSKTFAVDLLVAAAPHDRVIERADVRITMVGGTAIVMDARDGTLQVRVTAGTLVADRGLDAPSVTLFAGDTHIVIRDRRFAVRVEPSRLVFGSGEHAREAVERQLVELAPPPAPPVLVPGNQQSDASRDDHRAPTRPRLRVESVSVPEPISAAELYRRAETALAAHDSQRARELLEQLLRDHSNDQRVDAARYDLALIAHAAGDERRAVALLDEILANGGDASVRVAAEALRDRMGPIAPR